MEMGNTKEEKTEVAQFTRYELINSFLWYLKCPTLDSAISFFTSITGCTKEEITEAFEFFGIDSNMDFINFGE